MAELDMVRGAILRWLAELGRPEPMPEEFLRSELAVIDGVRVTPEDLESAVLRLERDGLIDGLIKMEERELPVRIRLNGLGRDCLEDFGEDVARWRQTRNAPMVDQSISVSGSYGVQLAAHTQGSVAQSQQVTSGELERLLLLGRAVEEAVAVLPDQDGELTRAARELVAEVDGATPEALDRGRLLKARDRVVGVLGQVGVGTAGGALSGVLVEALKSAI